MKQCTAVITFKTVRRYSMQFTSFLEDGTLTVVLTGEIDHHCAKRYIQAIDAKVEAYTPAVCILDFSEVSFIDSSGVAVVINALRAMKRMGGRLLLTGIGSQPMKVFQAAGVDKIIEIKEVTV
ncbi:MAG: STAS domain-containing protein [Ruminococcaceae bacterium]|nr:STAS domain-containing protein [Oscillospiraceae bacterium]